MRVLLGTDILYSLIKKDTKLERLSYLIKWLERLNCEYCVDASSIAILTNFVNLDSLRIPNNIKILKDIKSAKGREHLVEAISLNRDNRYLLPVLNRIIDKDVEFIISEDNNLISVAGVLNVRHGILSVEEFIDLCFHKYAELDETRGVDITRVRFGELDIKDNFFDSFIKDYSPYYHEWFKKKSDDIVYVARNKNGKIRGLLKIKIEETNENYDDITPPFEAKRRLKVCSLKANYSTEKLGQRFMRIVFETAIKENVEDIYITFFRGTRGHRMRLEKMLLRWGFEHHGMKNNIEDVYVRTLRYKKDKTVQENYPNSSADNGIFLISVSDEYMNAMLPKGLDCINSNKFYDNLKLSIRKSILLKTNLINIRIGSILLLAHNIKGTDNFELKSIGIVERVHSKFNSLDSFINRCVARMPYSKIFLRGYWQQNSKDVCVVDFLNTFPDDNNDCLIKNSDFGILQESIHGMEPVELNKNQLLRIVDGTIYEKTITFD